MKNKLVKALTLFCFIGFISIFIAYRSGKIETIMQSSPNGGSIKNSVYQDSIPKTDSLKLNQLMYSSKSMILIPPKTEIKDTLPKQTIYLVPDSIWDEEMLMSSSKSAIIFKKPFLIDSLKKTRTLKYKVK